jgi:hypothetical protein
MDNIILKGTKVNEDIHLVTILDLACTNSNKKKNIYHIVAIDNHISELVKNITFFYPKMLQKYMNIVNLKKIKLVTTFPTQKNVDIDKTNIFTSFKNITCGGKNMTDYEYYNNFFQSILDIVNNIDNDVDLIEIVIFSGINTNLTKQSDDIIIELSNKTNTTIIDVCGYNTLHSNICCLSSHSLDFSKSSDIELIHNIINNGIFLSYPLYNEKKMSIGQSNNTKLLIGSNGTICMDGILEHSFFVMCDKNSDPIIKLDNNDREIIIDGSNFSLKNLINAINYILDNLNNLEIDEKNITKMYGIYYIVKNKMIQIINTKEINKEIKYKAGGLYKDLNKIIVNLASRCIKLIENENSSSEILKLISEYYKSSVMIMKKSKHQNMVDERVLKNINILKELESLPHRAQQYEFTKFLNNCINSTDIKFKKSCEFFNSMITLSNWFDELNANGSMGIIVKVSSSSLGKLGINSVPFVENITNTFFPVVDFISELIKHFKLNENSTYFGNINGKNIVHGNAIGEGNAVIPLYINKYHWKIAKVFMKPMLGITLSHNPLGYTKNHDSLLFIIVLEMSKMIFSLEGKYINERFLECFIAILRTAAEVSFDRKFSRGIRKYVDLYVSDPIRRILQTNVQNMLGQCLSTGYTPNIDTIKKLIIYTIEERIRSFVYTNSYCTDYIDNLIRCDTSIKTEINLFIETLNYDMSHEIKILASFYKMSTVLKKIFSKVGSYNIFIKKLDAAYGLIDKEQITYLIDVIKKEELINDEITIEFLYNTIGEEYSIDKILFYGLQGIMHKTNKSRKEAIISGNYVDIYNKSNEEIMLLIKEKYGVIDLLSVK